VAVQRLLILTNRFPPKHGGAESYWKTFITSTEEASTRGETLEWKIEVQPWRCNLSIGRGSRLDYADLRSPAADNRIVVMPAFPAGLALARNAIPYRCIVHGSEVFAAARLPGARRLVVEALSRAECVVASSEFTAQRLRKLTNGAVEPVVVLPGVDVARYCVIDVEGQPGRAKSILAVGRLVRRKGFDVLIRAAASLVVEGTVPPFEVTIVGVGHDGPRLRGLTRLTRAPVRFAGVVSEEVLVRLYQRADMFVMPSRDIWDGCSVEGFGIALAEAAACGVPQISGFGGGVPEVVAHRETGFVVDGRAVNEVAAAMRLLLTDDGLRRQMAVASRRRAEKLFDSADFGKRLRSCLA
jgi:phosphatidyl-myo-inositol dimannoside synthase